jgi:hypothetical protein
MARQKPSVSLIATARPTYAREVVREYAIARRAERRRRPHAGRPGPPSCPLSRSKWSPAFVRICDNYRFSHLRPSATLRQSGPSAACKGPVVAFERAWRSGVRQWRQVTARGSPTYRGSHFCLGNFEHLPQRSVWRYVQNWHERRIRSNRDRAGDGRAAWWRCHRGCRDTRKGDEWQRAGVLAQGSRGNPRSAAALAVAGSGRLVLRISERHDAPVRWFLRAIDLAGRAANTWTGPRSWS